MVAIDTNVIIRFLTRDNEAQYKKAYRIFNREEVFIPDTVILETEWVLRFAYKFQPKAICDAFNRLFGLDNVYLSNPHSTAQAIKWHTEGLDFSDALHLAHSQECEHLYSFDAKFSTKAKGHSKCSVLKP